MIFHAEGTAVVALLLVDHRAVRIGPTDHRFRIQLDALDTGQLRHREPIRRRPVAGVAKADELLSILSVTGAPRDLEYPVGGGQLG